MAEDVDDDGQDGPKLTSFRQPPADRGDRRQGWSPEGRRRPWQAGKDRAGHFAYGDANPGRGAGAAAAARSKRPRAAAIPPSARIGTRRWRRTEFGIVGQPVRRRQVGGIAVPGAAAQHPVFSVLCRIGLPPWGRRSRATIPKRCLPRLRMPSLLAPSGKDSTGAVMAYPPLVAAAAFVAAAVGLHRVEGAEPHGKPRRPCPARRARIAVRWAV